VPANRISISHTQAPDSSISGPIRILELLYCRQPTILICHFERIKLASLRHARAFVSVADENFVAPNSAHSARNARFERCRSSRNPMFEDLDLLYAELVLLPI